MAGAGWHIKDSLLGRTRRIEKACSMLAAGKRRPDVFQSLTEELK
jgi:hypothetical protein